MKMRVERMQLDDDVTIGMLLIDGVFECWTLEDTVREQPGVPVGNWKVKGRTAIPRGTYEVWITHSPRFQRELPLLANVPGFEGIRIHPGNTAADTEGCILVGDQRLPKSIGQSRAAFSRLIAKIRLAVARGQRVTMEVT